MVRYASATSRVAASEPGGRRAMRSYINENFPHMVGKSSAVMLWLIDMLGDSVEGLRGKEKFWISRNFPGRPSLGIMERGDDW